MSNLREAAQQALEFVELCWRDVHLTEFEAAKRDSVEEALRAAIAQPDDKAPPVMPSDDEACEHFISSCDSAGIQYDGPSYEAGFLAGKAVGIDEADDKARQQPVAWVERWYGSDSERGWHIYEGRTRIASFGPDIDSSAVSAIVLAHNGVAPQPPAEQGAELSDEQIWDLWVFPQHLTDDMSGPLSWKAAAILLVRKAIAADRAARGGTA